HCKDQIKNSELKNFLPKYSIKKSQLKYILQELEKGNMEPYISFCEIEPKKKERKNSLLTEKINLLEDMFPHVASIDSGISEIELMKPDLEEKKMMGILPQVSQINKVYDLSKQRLSDGNIEGELTVIKKIPIKSLFHYRSLIEKNLPTKNSLTKTLNADPEATLSLNLYQVECLKKIFEQEKNKNISCLEAIEQLPILNLSPS
ncbi:MAG: hypothetical protein JWM09_1347, partial [Francisellaceae bacterium]|nr:hypothetical protein [Francisellaceae bacterium]